MKVTKRVFFLSNGSYKDGLNITKFINKEGMLCKHTNDYVWWQNLGLFPTKAKAINFAKDKGIKLDTHSMVIHTDWMYELALKDMIK